jgi:hypothetical protein
MALVAWALARMPAQTRGAMPLGAAPINTRHWLASGGLERHVSELLAYLERNQRALVHYAARRRNNEPISTAFVESSVNEIIAKRMNKKQQMRWNRATLPRRAIEGRPNFTPAWRAHCARRQHARAS